VRGPRFTRNTAIALIVAGDLLLLVCGWFLLVSPERSKAQSIAQAAQATEVQIVQAKTPVTVTPVTQPKQPEIRTAYLYKLSKAMPTTADMPNVLLELSQVVRASGVQLSSISPTPTDPVTGITAISLSVSGDFYSLTDLLYRLRSLVAVRNGALDVTGHLYAVKTVGFTPGKGTGLTANIQLNTFTFGAAAQAASAAAAAVPAPATGTTAGATTTTGATTPSADATIAP
jgi:Tfp pilus assembly protein PilO